MDKFLESYSSAAGQMSQRADCVFASSLGKGDHLHQRILTAFPLCGMSEEDLILNPQFCTLLAALSQHVDRTGLTQLLRRDLEKAEQELQTQKLLWLRAESIHRLLMEVLQEHLFNSCSEELRAEERKVSIPPLSVLLLTETQIRSSTSHASNGRPSEGTHTLEQCLMVGRCLNRMELRSDISEGQSGCILGLNPQRVQQQMPPAEDVCQMKQRLPSELLKHLEKKAAEILAYFHPERESESEGLRSVKLSKLPELLDAEQKRSSSLSEQNRDGAALLQRQTHAYLSELLKCMQILQCLVLDLRLKAQKDLDSKKIQYYEAKCELALQKIRAEMLQVQLDSYTRDKVATHRKIMEKLNTEMRSSELEKQELESKLSSFEIYGRDFHALAEEYSRLREEISTKSWALKDDGNFRRSVKTVTIVITERFCDGCGSVCSCGGGSAGSGRVRCEADHEDHHASSRGAARSRLPGPEQRVAGPGPRRRRGMNTRVRVQRASDHEDSAEEVEEPRDSSGEHPQAAGRVGAKKQRKLEEKQARRAQREAEQEEREERRRLQELRDQERQKEEEKDRLQEQKQEESLRRAREEQERREEEEYQHLKQQFVIEDQGETEEITEQESRSLLQEFVQFIKDSKVLLLEDLASHFGMRTQDAISRLQDLMADGTLTGVIDDRGKFIFITPEELKAFALFIRQRGRVSISELALASNTLISLTPDTHITA
ncbi:hypothetical protein DNTS_003259 [Danionella cerebrum]|uniref:DDRGK domain-containing protein 1 n=1 Tax=Danionella cerebrum TaxID=2873325 RepID=A0A553MVE7_9TELE|nr:hypothetical protein DNTS_003259 [Danionella translucida]